MKTPSEIPALSLRVMMFLIVAGCSVFLGFLAVDQVRKIPGSSVPGVAISLAVMLGTVFLVMADVTIRWLLFLCSGRVPRESRLWRRGLTWLMVGSCAAVFVFLFILTP